MSVSNPILLPSWMVHGLRTNKDLNQEHVREMFESGRFVEVRPDRLLYSFSDTTDGVET